MLELFTLPYTYILVFIYDPNPEINYHIYVNMLPVSSSANLYSSSFLWAIPPVLIKSLPHFLGVLKVFRHVYYLSLEILTNLSASILVTCLSLSRLLSTHELIGCISQDSLICWVPIFVFPTIFIVLSSHLLPAELYITQISFIFLYVTIQLFEEKLSDLFQTHSPHKNSRHDALMEIIR